MKIATHRLHPLDLRWNAQSSTAVVPREIPMHTRNGPPWLAEISQKLLKTLVPLEPLRSDRTWQNLIELTES